ncbi:MAG: META domain-containing protein, partial [Caldilinea sp.]
VPPSVATQLRDIPAGMTPYEHTRLLAAYGAPIPLYDHRSLGDVKTIIDCQEEIPFVDPEVLRQNQAVIPLPSLLPPFDFAASVRADQRACLDMGVLPAPAFFKDTVTGDQPVLLLAGTQDTVTPPLWAELAAASLPNAETMLFPAYGHALLYHAGECVVQIAAAFFDDPAQPIDASCVPTVEYALEQPPLVALTGRMWRLQGWAGEPADGLPITALFSGGRVIGLGGCSAYAGNFALTADGLAVDQLDAAGGHCTETEQALQEAFLDALDQARTVAIHGDRMLLTTASGDLLVFTREGDLPLEGPIWMLVAAAPADNGALTPILPDAPVTARFDDGMLIGALGCNLYEARYDLTDGLTVHDLQRIGEAVCTEPPGVMEQEETVLALLQSVTRYRVVGRELFLYGDSSAPLLVFYAASPGT